MGRAAMRATELSIGSGAMPAVNQRRPMACRPRWLLALVGLVALVAIGAPVASARAGAGPLLPSSDPFYTYSGSTPLAQIAPGTVLKTRAIQVSASGSTTPFTATQVLYRTTGEQGQPTVTVTTIIKPLAALGTKIVAYQTAYDALGSECDPSYTLAGGNPGYSAAQEEASIIEGYVTAGYTVVVSDYEGTHLDWGAGQESGYGTLDGIRAAENELVAPRSTPVGMVGYSGGSIATEWASELAPTYAPTCTSSVPSFLQSRLGGAPAVNGCGAIGIGNSLAPLPAPPAPGCPEPTGKLSGDKLGLARLGMTRAQARKAYSHSSNRGKRYEGFFCLTPIGVRVGYASPKLVGTLPRHQSRVLRGRVVWASTSNPYYTLKGVRPGAHVTAARKHLKLGKPFHVGLNYW
jgi:hypothetical protein